MDGSFVTIDRISLLSRGDITINGVLLPYNSSASTCAIGKHPLQSFIDPALNPGTQPLSE